jgi:hypothetical protein
MFITITASAELICRYFNIVFSCDWFELNDTQTLLHTLLNFCII